jgi:Uma2 family endonuclease
MATVQTKPMTAEEFFEFANRPENRGKRFELEKGEVVEVSSPGEIHGHLCGWITALLWQYVFRRGAGAVTTNDMGIVVQEGPDSVRGPDIVLFDEARSMEQLSFKHSRRVPTLVVEVVSPSDKPNKINQRISEYLRRGVRVVWIIDPEDRTVGIHTQGELPRTLDEKDEITGETSLPDLRLPVSELFRLNVPKANG